MDFRCSAARSRVALATAIVASAVAPAGGAGGSSQDFPVTCELIFRAAVERAMGETAGPTKIRASDEIRGAVGALGRRILETGDLNENASNYASLGICFFLELAKLEGWLDEVGKSPHFRNMFARMRDLISPVGSIPDDGDGYFEHRQIRLDFVLLLEMAARLYNDTSFQDATRRFLGNAPQGLDEDQLHRGPGRAGSRAAHGRGYDRAALGDRRRCGATCGPRHFRGSDRPGRAGDHRVARRKGTGHRGRRWRRGRHPPPRTAAARASRARQMNPLALYRIRSASSIVPTPLCGNEGWPAFLLDPWPSQ